MGTWGGDGLNLDDYLQRIGYTGDRTPTVETLNALHRAHVTSIPFENLEIMLGRPVLVDLEGVQRKLVRSQRGGYCFEHATLFAAALERLGFRFTALTGRVTLGGDPASRPGTHALLVVEFVGGERLLCDVGFGRGPLEPLPLRDGAEADQDGWAFRLTTEPLGDVFGTRGWRLLQRGADWIDRHAFTLNPQFPVDFRVGNHFVSTSPHSPFVARSFVQRFSADAHHTLDGVSWTTARPDGAEESRDVTPSEVPALLADVFGIVLDDADAAGVTAFEERRIAAAAN